MPDVTLQAEHMAAPTKPAYVKLSLANPEPFTHGTFRTCRDNLTMSAHRDKADIPPQGRDFRF
jgi:hypothetical protein